MIRCESSPDSSTVTVTFSRTQCSADVPGISVVGEFNGWDPGATPMHLEHGAHVATVELRPGRYRFRYLSEDGQWFNDEAAHDYEVNDQGGLDSVADLTAPAHGGTWEDRGVGTSHPTQDPEPAPPPHLRPGG